VILQHLENLMGPGRIKYFYSDYFVLLGRSVVLHFYNRTLSIY